MSTYMRDKIVQTLQSRPPPTLDEFRESKPIRHNSELIAMQETGMLLDSHSMSIRDRYGMKCSLGRNVLKWVGVGDAFRILLIFMTWGWGCVGFHDFPEPHHMPLLTKLK